jgi:hypothetical protein
MEIVRDQYFRQIESDIWKHSTSVYRNSHSSGFTVSCTFDGSHRVASFVVADNMIISMQHCVTYPPYTAISPSFALLVAVRGLPFDPAIMQCEWCSETDAEFCTVVERGRICSDCSRRVARILSHGAFCYFAAGCLLCEDLKGHVAGHLAANMD